MTIRNKSFFLKAIVSTLLVASSCHLAFAQDISALDAAKKEGGS